MVHWGLLDPHARYDSVALPRPEPEADVQLLLAAEVALHAGHVLLKQAQERVTSTESARKVVRVQTEIPLSNKQYFFAPFPSP